MSKRKMIKDVAPKISDAIQAMYDGLMSTRHNPLLKVDMSTYGDKNGIRCVGCAATYTLMKLDGGALTAIIGGVKGDTKRAKTFGFAESDMSRFEMCVNSFRSGVYENLFSYYGLDYYSELENKLRLPRIYLESRNWEKQMPDVRKIIEILKQHNL